MNLTHLIMFQFWAGASGAAAAEIGGELLGTVYLQGTASGLVYAKGTLDGVIS